MYEQTHTVDIARSALSQSQKHHSQEIREFYVVQKILKLQNCERVGRESRTLMHKCSYLIARLIPNSKSFIHILSESAETPILRTIHTFTRKGGSNRFKERYSETAESQFCWLRGPRRKKWGRLFSRSQIRRFNFEFPASSDQRTFISDFPAVAEGTFNYFRSSGHSSRLLACWDSTYSTFFFAF